MRRPRSLGELAASLAAFTVGWLVAEWWEHRQERKAADAKAEAAVEGLFRELQDSLEQQEEGGKL